MQLKRKNILIISYWSFKDALIQAYTLPYLRFILENQPKDTRLYLVTLEPGLSKSDLEKFRESQPVTELKSNNTYLLPFRYYPFGLRMLFQWIYIFSRLLVIIRRQKIEMVHTWCTPAGAAGYILSLISVRRLVLDSFEPHAEPMVESNTWSRKRLAFKLLFFLEKKQASRASGAIACVSSMRDYSQRKYGVVPPVFCHKPACVNLKTFSPDKCKDELLVKKFGFEDKIICVYAGKFGGSYMVKETFDFFRSAFGFWGDNFRVLLLSSHSDEEIESYCHNSNLPVHLVTKVFVPHSEVPFYMGLGDFGITPFVPVPSKRYGSPIKTGEYFALGLPVVITKGISDDSDQVEKYNAGYVLRSLDESEYNNAVRYIDLLLREEGLKSRIYKLARETRDFSIARGVYREFYKLLHKNPD